MCRMAIGSVTYATKAQRALARAAIHSEVVKIDTKNHGRGCTYGLEFGCSQRKNIELILKNSGINV